MKLPLIDYTKAKPITDIEVGDTVLAYIKYRQGSVDPSPMHGHIFTVAAIEGENNHLIRSFLDAEFPPDKMFGLFRENVIKLTKEENE
jgi:hypothetical protein